MLNIMPHKYLTNKKLIIYYFLLLCYTISGQEDSLTIKLNQLQNDSLKVDHLINSALNIIESNPFKSKDYSLEALNIAEEIEYEKGKAIANNLLGIADYELANYKAALHYFNLSIENFTDINDKSNVGKAYKNIGNVFLQQGNYLAALENYLLSLQISEELNDSIGVASAYHNIGNIHYEQFEFEKALEYYNKSIKIDSLIHDRIGMAKTLMNVGAIYMDMGDYSLALKNYYQSLTIFSEFNDMINTAICYNNIASVHHEKGDYSNAIGNYLKAIEIYKEIGSTQGVASTSYSIGTFYNSIQDYNKALAYLNKSLNLSKKIGSLKTEASAALAISETYYKINNFKKAYQYHLYFKKLSDLLKSEENIKNLTRVQLQYEFDQKLKEEEFKQLQREAAHKAEIRQQRLFMSFLAIGLLLTIGLVFLIYRNYKIKQRDNILLASQKEEIASQKDEIEKQRDIATQQRDQIQKQKQEITDSILYARKIQKAILPPLELIDELFNDYFILYKPRDIVSGDFYWMHEVDNKIVIAVSDCTGHGVPGAFMSMLGISFLNEIISSIQEVKASVILDELKKLVIKSLHQTGKLDEAKDGMDISLIILDKENKKIQYSGAYNSLYLIRNGELIETKADRMPIGIYIKSYHEFTNHEIDILSDDRIYMFSDGYPDQFGGGNMQKFKTKKLKELLVEIHQHPMLEQKKLLEEILENWMGDMNQIDDILIFGIKL